MFFISEDTSSKKRDTCCICSIRKVLMSFPCGEEGFGDRCSEIFQNLQNGFAFEIQTKFICFIITKCISRSIRKRFIPRKLFKGYTKRTYTNFIVGYFFLFSAFKRSLSLRKSVLLFYRTIISGVNIKIKFLHWRWTAFLQIIIFFLRNLFFSQYNSKKISEIFK